MEKSIKIFSQLPEEVKMMWLTQEQVIEGYPEYFAFKENVDILEVDEEVEKRHFVIQTNDYRTWLKVQDGKFFGCKYMIRLFYSRENIEKVIKKKRYRRKKPFETEDSFMVDRDNVEVIKDLRSNLYNRKALLQKYMYKPIDFYGEKVVGAAMMDHAHMFRAYHALFMNFDYIRMAFMRTHKITLKEMEAMGFMYVYKFFSFNDMRFFRSSRRWRTEKGKEATIRRFMDYFIRKGIIEPVMYSGKSMYKRPYDVKKRGVGKLYKLTDKYEKLYKEFIEYAMYFKKMPYVDRCKSGLKPTYYDIKYPGRYNPDAMAYSLYEYVYDYINYKSEVEFFEGTMDEFLLKMKSEDFHFNPVVYRLAERRFIRSKGEDTGKKYIDKMLSASRWGIDV